MKQDAFERKYRPVWEKFEHWVSILSHDHRRLRVDRDLRLAIAPQFPALYRQVCHHLALARTRQYSVALQQRLNALALDGHRHLYQSRASLVGAFGQFLTSSLPSTFRKQWRFMLVSAAVFYLPAIAIAIAIAFKPELVFSLLEPAEVAQMESMYDPANSVLGRERESDTDVYMFGFYIYNNVSIGFQTYAGGLVFGLGSLFYLIFNGLVLGAVAMHLTLIGFSETFWPFVAGHSAFELTAIMIFGGVGLMIGYGGIAPGRKKRWHAIRDQATAGMPLVYGGALMLVVAAFIEAFWSSSTWPPLTVKYGVGLSLWVALALYFMLLGRNGPE
ncbi:MAG TPA: stage II sporulation protein M [Woeseiaceae bacterium]|nr:stage II sporulation protein M [Woeseiaceae bacterium]